jgi:two-component system, NarL family, response regulator NreC
MRLSILLAEDHQIVREGLRALLEREGYTVAGEASNGREAVQQAARLTPDVVVLDLSMPFLNGIEAAREILLFNPRARTVILTVHDDDQYVLQAFQAGIRGYVLKTRAASELTAAIERVSKGKLYLSPALPSRLVQPFTIH